MFPDNFNFHHPWVLALLALLPLYALLAGRMGKVAALSFPSTETARLAGARARAAPGRWLLLFRLLALAALIIACAGPRRSGATVEQKADGRDIMLVLDLSGSMQALDMSPRGEDLSRVTVAKNVIRTFVDKRPDDRIGLVAFAGKPYLVSPLTLNHAWLERALDRLDTNSLPDDGTAIGDAIAMAADRLKKRDGKAGRVIILLTDGDDNSSVHIAPAPSAELAAALGLRLYTIGIGGDKPTPMPAIDPTTGKPMRDANGDIVSQFMMDPANYSLLQRMAKIASGRFYRAKNNAELGAIYGDIDKLETSEVKITRHVAYTELFAPFALAALLALLAEVALANTRHLRLP